MPMGQQAHLLASITGTKHEPQFNCPSPATRCAWDTFSSLAVCGTFSNATDTALKNCTTLYQPRFESLSRFTNVTYDNFINVTCKLSLFDMRTEPLTLNWYTGRTNAGALPPVEYDGLPGGYEEYRREPLDCAHYDLLDASIEGLWQLYRNDPPDEEIAFQDQLSALYAKLYVARTLDHEILYNISNVRDYTSAMWQLPMRTELLRASWNLCEQVYSDVSVDLGVLSVGNVTANPLALVATDSGYTLQSNASGLNYTVAESGSGEWDEGALSQLLDLHLGYSPMPWWSNPTYRASDSNYIVYSMPHEKLKWSFSDRTLDDALHPVSGLTQSLSIYLRSADIEALTNNVASTLTARIRSNTAGGNANLTMLPGQAFVNETYIAVQWPWMILPITETVLAAAALAITIVLTRQQALLKGSTVSLLMHQIDGWSPEDTRVRRLDTSEQVRDRAKKMVVRLDEGRDGEMVFKR